MCNPPVSSNGIITVSWYYIHRGGLDINGLSVSYTYEEGSVITAPVDVSVPSFDATSASVSGLVAGNDYTFTVTASNANGSTSIQCGPTSHDVGKVNSITSLINIRCRIAINFQGRKLSQILWFEGPRKTFLHEI